MINNRQAGRRRGRGGQRTPGSNPGRGPENGNRIDNRARGNAAQLLEKYKTLARDAQMQGDRVNTEYYLQFADHYFRVLAETRSRFEENQPRRNANEQFDDGDEEDFDGNAEGMAEDRVDPYQADRGDRNASRDGGNRDGGNRESSNRDAGYRDNGNRDTNGRDNANRDAGNRDTGNRDSGARDGNRGNGRDQNRDGARDGGNRENYGNRSSAPRDGGQRDNQRDTARDNVPRDSIARDNAPRAAGPDRQPRRYQAEETGSDPVGVVNAPAHPAADEGDRPRRGRPRRATPATDSVTQHDEDIAIDADRLPPSLSLSAIVSDADVAPAEEKPRRRRRTPTSETTVAE